MRFFTMTLLLTSLFFANDLTERFPDYRYVLSEFDIDSSYVDNESFVRFAEKNEKGLRRFYRYSLTRGEGVLRLLRGELLEEGLSDLFLYLSIVESGLSLDAVSPKSAAGLWQFMPKTARAYNLEVCYGVDERYDPFRSTKAAIVHLRRLHEKFGKWYVAVLAYNCGEGRLQNAIERAGTDDIEVLLDEQTKYLPKETREYMKKILLIAMIGENETIDFPASKSSDPLLRVEVAGGTDLKALSGLLEMNPERLLKMNSMFPNGKVPRDKRIYHITIPVSKMVRFYMRYHLPEKRVSVKPHLVSYSVKLGDTLESIAKRYESSVNEIKAVNRMGDEILEVGSILLIPVSEERFDRLLGKERSAKKEI